MKASPVAGTFGNAALSATTPDPALLILAETPAFTPDENKIVPCVKFDDTPLQLMVEAVEPEPTVPVLPKALFTSPQPES